MNDLRRDNKKKKTLTRGGKNLVILGVASIFLAVITTGASLAIYHNSGDIYLDRSRPGYLPDEEEIEKEEDEEEEDYSFEKSGELTIETIEEYLEKIQTEVQAIDSYEDPFGADVLSDKNLGIPEE